jgi:hypothetical protein
MKMTARHEGGQSDGADRAIRPEPSPCASSRYPIGCHHRLSKLGRNFKNRYFGGTCTIVSGTSRVAVSSSQEELLALHSSHMQSQYRFFKNLSSSGIGAGSRSGPNTYYYDRSVNSSHHARYSSNFPSSAINQYHLASLRTICGRRTLYAQHPY